MTRAEERLRHIHRQYEAEKLGQWQGQEQEVLIELVRALDETAFAFHLAVNRDQLRANDGYRQAMLQGVSAALRPFLARSELKEGGLPWIPSTPGFAAAVDHYLWNCGTIVHLTRLAALEAYGLANTRFAADDQLTIEVASADAEAYDRGALNFLRRRAQTRRAQLDGTVFERLAPEVTRRMHDYVGVDPFYFIRYDNDIELVIYYRELAAARGVTFFESEALPDASRLGERTFGDWCLAATAAHGRVLQHIAFVTLLRSRHPNLNLRNLLTMFVRKEDLHAALEEQGDIAAADFMSAAALDSDQADIYTSHDETPAPFYIPAGKDFYLLPCFGALMNPFVGVVRFLKDRYRSDWDKAVDGREKMFRNELRDLLGMEQYYVSNTGICLKRSDGSELTDVDAVVLDRATGVLGLFQLKWPDIHGRSLRERHSRRLNLLKANDWVAGVSNWLEGRSMAEITAICRLPPGVEPTKVDLVVVSRYASRFTADGDRDDRATWCGWADIVRVASRFPDRVFTRLRELQRAPRRARPLSTDPETFNLPGLSVQVVVNPEFGR